MKEKFITIVLTIIIVVVPIAIRPTQSTLLKAWILLICGALLLALSLLNYKKLKFDKSDFLLLGFAGIIFISTMCSSDILVSLFGYKNRYEGMLIIYVYIIIYLCAKKFFKYKKRETLLKVFQILYILIGIIAILQHTIQISTWKVLPLNKGVCGTFGNTNFMGNFVSIGLPIFIVSYILKAKKLSLITSLITFFGLITCGARSGWVAFIVFIVCLIIYLIKKRKKEYLKRFIVLILGFSIIFSGIYLKEDNIVKNKFSKIKSEIKVATEKGTNNGLGSGRIQIWKITLDLIQKYPLLGVGTDNLQKGIVDNLTQTSYDFIIKYKAVPDKAHNEYLQIAATLGIPALAIYLIFLCLIIFPKIKSMLNNGYIFCVGSVIVSYLVQAFFNISTIGIAPIFWFALGLLDNKWFTQEQYKEGNV